MPSDKHDTALLFVEYCTLAMALSQCLLGTGKLNPLRCNSSFTNSLKASLEMLRHVVQKVLSDFSRLKGNVRLKA